MEDIKFISQLDSKLQEIINSIIKHCNDTPINNNYGLYDGYSGVALFLYYYYIHSGNEEIKSNADKLLTRIFKSINQQDSLDLNYCSGLSGVYSLIYHLYKKGFINNSEYLLDDSISDVFSEKMFLEIKLKNYDLFYGAIGYLNYFYFKFQYGQLQSDAKVISKAIRIIRNNIEKDIMNLGYFQGESGLISLGIPHGLPGFLLLLSKIYRMSLSQEDTLFIMHKIASLMTPFVNDRNQYSYFPSTYNLADNPSEVKEISRLGWCYGDIGCAISLLEYSLITRDTYIYNSSLKVLSETSKRKDLISNSIYDAGLCHGCSGIAMIYNRLYGDYNLNAFKDYSEYWYKQTILFSRFETGNAGYCSAKRNFNGDYVYYNDVSLLTGIAGVGLSLLSKLSNNENDWEIFFFK